VHKVHSAAQKYEALSSQKGSYHSSRLYQAENDFVRNQHIDVDRNSNKIHSQILSRLAGY